ncbi:unnamed protein product [Cuscuta europaea]|uniref:ABC transporter domain-containing protein n=2 Tax=Cuscuta europaea TaxID=41803 RepID=A0A9P0ZBT8_CUSEU|nr:unnamed protein product [Cuscuta europaea]
MHRQKEGHLYGTNAFFFCFISVLVSPATTRPSYAALDVNNPAEVQLLTRTVSNKLKNFTALFGDKITEQLGFCIENVDVEWKRAFDFTDTEFLSNCIKRTKGDMMERLCTASEIQFYAANIMMGALQRKSTNFVTLNKNCNLSSWNSGCDPGWACSVGKDVAVDLKNMKEIPTRTNNCQPCCEGFFCPHGLTCMLPCPLGSYCPLAKLNEATAGCDPYNYQVQPGQSNQTCGGADMWADIITGHDLFCPAGSYCPTTIQKIPCDSGHYCRTGSTTQTKCVELATCDPQTENQNITAYGALLVAGIILILFVIYNCSDRVLSTREKRQAKSREAAVRSVRETVQARQKWKSAKDIARKRATELQSQLSRTFSRKRSVREETKISCSQPTDSSLPPDPSEDNSESYDDFNIEIEGKNSKKKPHKAKHLHTRSEIFRYAYGEIEKEKALQENSPNLSFSGVISMGTDSKFITRPPIEVAFKDLTLTLKGEKKHLLRCVYGKLSPGRVSAVMGPSGAGKTTFISALTGKAIGCNMSGVLLINGKVAAMQPYKKIIGFVPQDDIVHGNLTVQENLWFSAICRLPAKLPKAEKVLVVERVIESLGLQNVRDSLVGTVEKRGISGGQRKRVNVGLEMVMEPSLLILDEPTSGLDSASSQLLLRALRREALEGVNICMVLHQPSYALFNMFDDFILLAKGGLVVYHGPVKKVEEYFAGLGIHVPERVNPPDYFIDLLEGIEKLSPDIGVNYKDLPLRWMLHNGYPVPPDMLEPAGLPSAPNGENAEAPEGAPASEEPDVTLLENLWLDLKSNAVQKKDQVQHYFLTLKDLSNRETPGLLVQYKYFLGRIGKQRLREAMVQAVDYLILLLAGICLGTLAKVSDESFGTMGYLYTVIAVSLLTKIAALRSFSLDKLHYWRESASGMSSLAFFMAKDTVDHLNTIVKPAVYLSMFYFFNNPRSTIQDNYLVLLCLVYAATGIAYVLAICFEPGQAQLWSVLLPVVLTLVANQRSDSYLGQLGDFCYTKWTLEAFLIANAKRYSGVWLITRCGVLKQKSFLLSDWYSCLGCLILTGILSRIIAFFSLIAFQRK